MKWIFSAIFLLTPVYLFSQRIDLALARVPDSLKQNANAIVRLDRMDLAITSQREMTIREVRIVTVLNENGLSSIGASCSYDKRTSVKSIEATVYDTFGNEIKKIKKRDFKDQCIIDGITLFSDNRVIYLEYTPTQYPFTIVYESEVRSSNTAFLPRWYFIARNYTSVEECQLNVVFPDDLGFKKKEFNFSNFPIKKLIDSPTQLSYEATGIPAQKPETLSPNPEHVLPWVLIGLERFNMEGVDGYVRDWKEFGQWYSQKLLYDTNDLPEETKTKMKQLVGNEKDPIRKAKIIYNYLQQKSRYVSIQVGIGGFKPMHAKDVDRLGYGDCKALSNYMQSLLRAVEVDSYLTLVYGDSDKIDIQQDFVSMQGNHMILAIPTGDTYTWLECTSQDVPFGYQANFTDDRAVVIIKPEGAVVVKTKNYLNDDNSQFSKGFINLDERGMMTGSIQIDSRGAQYGRKFYLADNSPNENEKHYKEYWSNINNLKMKSVSFANDKETIMFTENLIVSGENYGTFSGDKLLFPVNAFNQENGAIRKIRNRKTAFEIQRGTYDLDEIEINLPAGFTTEFLPDNLERKSKFGAYTCEIKKVSPDKLLYKRSFLLKQGIYQNTDYEDFRLFLEQISRNDNAKVVLIKQP